MNGPDRPDWIATDLDGTFFCRGQGEGSVPATWRGCEGTTPTPSSWIPEQRHRFLRGLAGSFRIVPVTARDHASFKRVRIVDLPFIDGAVIANGAILLKPKSMQPDPEWDLSIAPQLAVWADALAHAMDLLQAPGGAAVRPRLVPSNTPHPAYLVAKAESDFWRKPTGLELRASLGRTGCLITEVGAELQVLPPPISKSLGLMAFTQRFCQGVPPLLGLGDMPGDFSFMRQAEFLGMPSGSNLASGWHNV